jgi:hypothetical protein
VGCDEGVNVWLKMRNVQCLCVDVSDHWWPWAVRIGSVSGRGISDVTVESAPRCCLRASNAKAFIQILYDNRFLQKHRIPRVFLHQSDSLVRKWLDNVQLGRAFLDQEQNCQYHDFREPERKRLQDKREKWWTESKVSALFSRGQKTLVESPRNFRKQVLRQVFRSFLTRKHERAGAWSLIKGETSRWECGSVRAGVAWGAYHVSVVGTVLRLEILDIAKKSIKDAQSKFPLPKKTWPPSSKRIERVGIDWSNCTVEIVENTFKHHRLWTDAPPTVKQCTTDCEAMHHRLWSNASSVCVIQRRRTERRKHISKKFEVNTILFNKSLAFQQSKLLSSSRQLMQHRLFLSKSVGSWVLWHVLSIFTDLSKDVSWQVQ